MKTDQTFLSTWINNQWFWIIEICTAELNPLTCTFYENDWIFLEPEWAVTLKKRPFDNEYTNSNCLKQIHREIEIQIKITITNKRVSVILNNKKIAWKQ